ncbi:MAG: DEAD/DEAH box helicase [Rhodospirillaceae bacterium]
MTLFSELSLRPEIQQALIAQEYRTPTPIQAGAIPPALLGRDILGIAQTGTGKTAAFTLPILQRLAETRDRVRAGGARSLILTPTRELAIQIGESIRCYGAGLSLRSAVIFGGVGQAPQVSALRGGLDILVATPGRLLDLMNQGHVRFDRLEVFVLDEADRMLDMGFIHDVRKVIATLPARRQTLFFSATMPGEISSLAARLLKDPVRVEVAPVATTAERVEQQVIFVPAAVKRHLLVDMLGKDAGMDRVMVFTRTKHGANKVAEHLVKANVSATAIHGNKSQSARQAALEGFRAGTVRVLVATDIAARGIDVDAVSHVVNFELPNIPESYVHRIGRTARAGASGIAVAFCDDGEERGYLRDIEKLTRVRLTVVDPGPMAPVPASQAHAQPVVPPRSAARPPRRDGQGQGHGHGDHSGARERGRRDAPAPVRAAVPAGRDRPRTPRAERSERSGPSAFGDLVSALNGGPAPRKADGQRK